MADTAMAMVGRVCALIPGAGRGVRFGGGSNKVLTPLLDRPLLGWTLEAFAQCRSIEAIILVASADEVPLFGEIGEKYGGGKVRAVVAGGADRQTSVRNGLRACDGFDFVAIHDAARPCVTPELIEKTVYAAQTFGGATLAAPVVDTMVRGIPGEDTVQLGPLVPRDDLYAIQTPQVFSVSRLRQAHETAQEQGWAATDDAGIMARLGLPVALVESPAQNLKVTRAADLALAEAILSHRKVQSAPMPDAFIPSPFSAFPELRVGHGYDVHPFVEGRRLFLGGVEFENAAKGLLGHSDADVVLHALCDALLGAASLGDIGRLFPPSDMRHKDRRSTEFLDEVRARLDDRGWVVQNVDISILAEFPKIGPKAEAMQREIAVHLGIQTSQIGIKATTNEGLGFIGRGEGVAVHATVLLARPGGV